MLVGRSGRWSCPKENLGVLIGGQLELSFVHTHEWLYLSTFLENFRDLSSSFCEDGAASDKALEKAVVGIAGAFRQG